VAQDGTCGMASVSRKITAAWSHGKFIGRSFGANPRSTGIYI
jgi:hypothetical protein